MVTPTVPIYLGKKEEAHCNNQCVDTMMVMMVCIFCTTSVT